MSKYNQWQMEFDVGKSSWLELVGASGNQALITIVFENPKVTATAVAEGSPPPTDFRCDRVLVYVDNQDIVTRVPRIG